MENIYTVLITVITTLGGASAWRFYEKRANHSEEDERFVRHDLQTRIVKLEALLEMAGKEKDSLREMVLHLSTEVATLTTKIAFLETQNKKGNI